MDRELFRELCQIVKNIVPPDDREAVLDILTALDDRMSLARVRRRKREARDDAHVDDQDVIDKVAAVGG